MTGDLIAVGCGLAAGVAAAVMYVAVNWERLHAGTQRVRRRGLVMVSETGRRVAIEGGWTDVKAAVFVASAVIVIVPSWFVGWFVIGRWIWGIA